VTQQRANEKEEEMPRTAPYALVWSSVHQAYKLHERQGSGVLDIVPESSDWLPWVSQLSSFSFHGKHGSFTACKERRQRGEGYWYAYARVGGKLIKHYLGKSRGLTIFRLEQVAQELQIDTSETSLPEEETGASQLPFSSSVIQPRSNPTIKPGCKVPTLVSKRTNQHSLVWRPIRCLSPNFPSRAPART
jgi:hypothetical protein